MVIDPNQPRQYAAVCWDVLDCISSARVSPGCPRGRWAEPRIWLQLQLQLTATRGGSKEKEDIQTMLGMRPEGIIL